MSLRGSVYGSVICIVGPTASGKSTLAELVAKSLDTSIISVDAMQVYKGMNIGTAKTPLEERKVPLLMVDCASVLEEYSVQMFQAAAREAAHNLISVGKIPVFCGGTGLYLDSIIDQMDFPAGSVNSPIRAYYEKLAAQIGAEGLYELLANKDLKSAQLIHPNNVRRVVRALELLEEGKSYATHHKGLKAHMPYFDAHIWGLTMNRTRLYEQINERVDVMFEQGLVKEVKKLIEIGLSPQSTAGQAIGYKEFFAYFDGFQTLDKTKELIKQHTRQYAKRQISWLKRDGRVSWLDMDHLSLSEAAQVILDSFKCEA